jgi:ferredoxin
MIKVTAYDAQRKEYAFEGKEGSTVLEQLEAAGISAPYSCRSGTCNVCSCKVSDGNFFIDHEAFGKRLADPGKGRLLTCIAGFKKRFLEDAEAHEVVISL